VRGIAWRLLCAALAAASADAEPPRAARTLAEAESVQVQLVTVRRGDGRALARGSAFYVDAGGRLLTCAHVLDHMPKDESHRLRLRDGRERRFTIVKIDREVDLAVLQSDAPEYFLTLDRRPLPEVGEVVRLGGLAARRATDDSPAVSFRPAAVVALERRWATGTRRTVGGRRRIVSIKVDEVADFGQSGGPLLAEGSLAVVGVLRANLARATGGLGGRRVAGFGAAVPLLYVHPLLEPVD
jgi:S1-C subfamily serine protease